MKMRRIRIVLLLPLLVSLAATLPALAHHSVTGQFDMKRQISLKGTISRVDWINPHTFVYLDVKDANGAVKTWKWESLPVAFLRRAGINKNMLIGQSVTAIGWPAADQTAQSAFLGSLTMSDGRTIQIAGDEYLKQQGKE